MKFILLCLVLFSFVSCTHSRKMEDIEKRISATETMEYSEIQNDIQLLIDRHPELTLSQREKLKSQFLEGFERHRMLKDQERQVIGLLLHANLDPSEKEEYRSALKVKLEEVYKMKAQNIEVVVENVATPLRDNSPRQEFEKDFKILMREFR